LWTLSYTDGKRHENASPACEHKPGSEIPSQRRFNRIIINAKEAVSKVKTFEQLLSFISIMDFAGMYLLPVAVEIVKSE
jgi:hypothetical protein